MINNIPMIDFLKYVYIESRKDDELKSVPDIDSKIENTFSSDWLNLTVKQQWLLHKYAHSVHVYKTGVNIISNEKELKSQPENIKKDWCIALLMHDIGRANEINNKGKRTLKYPHGTLGIEILKQQGIKSPHILFPVLMHDRINFDIFSLEPEDVMTDLHFSKVPIKVKKTVKSLLKKYHQMDPKERQTIHLGCNLIIDADQLANLKDFDKMLNLSRLPMIPVISEPVERAVKEKHYVDYQDLKTYPDEAVAYMAWMFYGNFPTFYSELIKKDLLNNIRLFVIKKMTSNNSPKAIKLLDKKLKELQKIIEKNLHTKTRK